MQASPDNRDWQRFLDATVHDLRAALRAIGTSAELLAETCGAVPGLARQSLRYWTVCIA